MSDDRNNPFGLPGSGIESSGIPGTGTGGISGIPGSGSSSGPAPSARPEPAARPSLEKQPSPQRPVFNVPEPPQALAGSEAMVLADWGVRFGAWFLDQIFRALIALPVPLLAFVLIADDPFGTTIIDPASDGSGISNLGGIGLSWLLLFYVLAFFYAPITMARNRGATWGKKMVGIRVVTEAGVPPTFGQSFVREPLIKGILITLIGGLIFLPWLLSYLWPLWDEQSRAGHDFLAKTRVIRAT